MVDHPLLTAVERLPKAPKSTGSVPTFSPAPLPRGATTLQQPGRGASVGLCAAEVFPPTSRIARILRFAYLCLVYPGVRLVSRIHVDLLRSASALCLQSHL
ncbi:putative leader peptide [Streptomyces niveus]